MNFLRWFWSHFARFYFTFSKVLLWVKNANQTNHWKQTTLNSFRTNRSTRNSICITNNVLFYVHVPYEIKGRQFQPGGFSVERGVIRIPLELLNYGSNYLHSGHVTIDCYLWHNTSYGFIPENELSNSVSVFLVVILFFFRQKMWVLRFLQVPEVSRSADSQFSNTP